MTPLEELIEEIKPTVYKIIEDSGTLLPNFIERRIADKYIRSTIVTLVAKYGPQVSSGVKPLLPLAEEVFQKKYYDSIKRIQEIASTSLGEYGETASNTRLKSLKENIFK